MNNAGWLSWFYFLYVLLMFLLLNAFPPKRELREGGSEILSFLQKSISPINNIEVKRLKRFGHREH